MQSFATENDVPYENLSNTILEAIKNSEEVKAAVNALQEKNLVDDSAAINLVLSLEELASLMAPGHPAVAGAGARPLPPQRFAGG
jgi:hypothetical protein